jgi:hypothetical protein
MTPKRKVNKVDRQGRPVDVTFEGDPAKQCPGCLSENVEPFRAVGLVQVGDGDAFDSFAPVRRMKCLACGARWFRQGV